MRGKGRVGKERKKREGVGRELMGEVWMKFNGKRGR